MSEKTLKVHPAASAFPKITGKDLKELSEDIKAALAHFIHELRIEAAMMNGNTRINAKGRKPTWNWYPQHFKTVKVYVATK